jgi:hypothetical protein
LVAEGEGFAVTKRVIDAVVDNLEYGVLHSAESPATKALLCTVTGFWGHFSLPRALWDHCKSQ